jgi:hypothetical protein
MKSLVFTILFALCAMTAFADATGKWTGTFTPEGQEPQSAYVILKQDGASLTGTGGPNESEQWPIAKGKVEGNRITGEVTSPEGDIYKINLTIDGDKAKGEVVAIHDGQEMMKAKIELTRLKS